MAELISMRLLPLWVGARGIEFSWKYIQLSFEANISLVSDNKFVCLSVCVPVLFWLFIGFASVWRSVCLVAYFLAFDFSLIRLST